MQKTPELRKPRVAKFDNAKALLIFLVVFGHGIAPFLGTHAGKFLDLWMYSFHMPLFVFIGGLFAKRTVNSKPFDFLKFFSFIALHYFIKTIEYFAILGSGQKATFRWFFEKNVAWYIFVMALHLLIAHLLRKINPIAVIIGSFAAALAVGYIDCIEDTLMLSRVFVFFPLFYIGYAVDSNKLIEALDKKSLRILSVVILVAFTLITFFYTDELYKLRYLFTGNNPYYEFGDDWYPYGAILRTIAYSVSIAVSLCFLVLIPKRHLPVITTIGSRSMSIYVFHRPLQHLMNGLFLVSALKGDNPKIIMLIIFGISVVLTLLLTLKIFEYILYPFTNSRKIWNGIKEKLAK